MDIARPGPFANLCQTVLIDRDQQNFGVGRRAAEGAQLVIKEIVES